MPVFHLDDIPGIADFILARTGLGSRGMRPRRGRRAAAARDDCFALPPGVDWMPVDDAIARLRDGLAPVADAETVPLGRRRGAASSRRRGRARAHPPRRQRRGGRLRLRRTPSLGHGAARAAAGGRDGRRRGAVRGEAAGGRALRILTGALLPGGSTPWCSTRTSSSTTAASVRFERGLKRGANTRAAGEDVPAGAQILTAGRRLRPQDLALAAAVGLAELPVRRRLRVAVLSTGDEIRCRGRGGGGAPDLPTPIARCC